MSIKRYRIDDDGSIHDVYALPGERSEPSGVAEAISLGSEYVSKELGEMRCESLSCVGVRVYVVSRISVFNSRRKTKRANPKKYFDRF